MRSAALLISLLRGFVYLLITAAVIVLLFGRRPTHEFLVRYYGQEMDEAQWRLYDEGTFDVN